MSIYNHKTLDPLEDSLTLISLNYSLESINNSIAKLPEIQNNISRRVSITVESFEKNQISLESFTETIKKYWQKFIAWIKKIISSISEFFEKVFTSIGRRKAAIKRMKNRVEEITDSMFIRKILDENKEFEINKENMNSFLINNEFQNNGDKLLDAIDDSEAAYNFIKTKYANNIIKRADIIKKTIQTATIENSKKEFEDLINKLKNNDISKQEFNILGNKRVVYTPLDNKASTITDLKNNKVSFEDIDTKIVNGKFNTMKPDEMFELLKHMDFIIDLFESFKKKEYREILDRQKDLISTTDKYVNKISSYFKTNTDVSRGSSDTYRQLMDLNSVYLDWIKTPVMMSLKSMVTSFYQITQEIDKNISLYKLQEGSTLFSCIASPKSPKLKADSNGKTVDLITPDPSIGIAGGACTFIINEDIMSNLKHHKEFLDKHDNSLVTTNKQLKHDVQSMIDAGLGTTVIVFSSKLKASLTPQEYKAVRDHEIGHAFHKHIEDMENTASRDSNDVEIEADAYSLKHNSAKVLRSAIEKCIQFGSRTGLILVKDTKILKGLDWINKRILNNVVASKIVQSYLISSTKKAHNARLNTLNKLVKEEEKKAKKKE